jgi:acetyltransferase-like isoleucine patch superfamily enzyme
MEKIKKILRYLKMLAGLNFKTIYFNFKYLPTKQAVIFPIAVSKTVHLMKTDGQIIFDCPVRPGMVRIGYGDVGIFDKKLSRSIWQVSGTVTFKGSADIGHGSKLSVGGNLVLGDGFKITAESSIVASKKIEFGENCLLSWDVLIMDTDFHIVKDKSENILNPPTPITIGNKVWIGCRCTILKGADIPDNSVIGANSLVSKKLDKENATYGGQPARILREEITWTP